MRRSCLNRHTKTLFLCARNGCERVSLQLSGLLSHTYESDSSGMPLDLPQTSAWIQGLIDDILVVKSDFDLWGGGTGLPLYCESEILMLVMTNCHMNVSQEKTRETYYISRSKVNFTETHSVMTLFCPFSSFLIRPTCINVK